MKPDRDIELCCWFSGRVQGVGFRWTTLRTLEGMPLEGYVRNLMDGRVELRLQGPRPLVEEAVQLVRSRMAPNISDVELEEHEITERLGPLGVR